MKPSKKPCPFCGREINPLNLGRHVARHDAPLQMPYIVRVEITTAAVIQAPDDKIVGGNMVDTTLAFGWRTSEPPEGASDARIVDALTLAISPVLALLATAMTQAGWIAIGQIDEQMKAGSREVGKGKSYPVTIRFDGPVGRA